MQIFSKKEAINIGWKLMIKHLGFMVLAYAVYFCVLMAIGLIQAGIERMLGKGLLSFNISIVSYLLSFLLVIGLIKILLDLYDEKKVGLSELFKNYEQYFNYIICNFLVSLITICGLILLVVPGIIWGLKYQYAPYLVIDKNMKPLEAIKRSGEMTYGHKMNLFLFCFAAFGVLILGFMCCGIGILPAGIVTSFAVIHIYRKLLTDYERNNKTDTVRPVCDPIPSLESVAQNPENPVKTEEPNTTEKPVDPAQ